MVYDGNTLLSLSTKPSVKFLPLRSCLGKSRTAAMWEHYKENSNEKALQVCLILINQLTERIKMLVHVLSKAVLFISTDMKFKLYYVIYYSPFSFNFLLKLLNKRLRHYGTKINFDID